MTTFQDAAGQMPVASRGSRPRDAFEIVDLVPEHLPEAARIHSAEYRRLRSAVPSLPPRFADPKEAEKLLRSAFGAGPAVAAIQSGELIGYVLGFPVEGLRGSGTAAFVPEWAMGVAGADRQPALEAMYVAIASRWLESAWFGHFITLLAGDPELERTLVWLGFGTCVIDAVRSLDPRVEALPVTLPEALPQALPQAVPEAVPLGIAIRRATLGDVDALVPLARAHDSYYRLSPTFLFREKDVDQRAALRRWIETPGESVWIACAGSRAVSFLYLRPPADDVCRALRDRGTISIGGAFTAPEWRSAGVGRALLGAVVDWTRSEGFERLAVDFETANPLARRFWLRSFMPIAVTYERHVDDRVGRQAGWTER